MNVKRYLVAAGALALVGLPALAMPVSVDLPKQAKAGERVTVCVSTEKDAKCKIEAQDAGLTQALKLIDQKPDAAGKASWTFDVPKDYKADEMPVIVTVEHNNDQEKVTRSIAVVR